MLDRCLRGFFGTTSVDVLLNPRVGDALRQFVSAEECLKMFPPAFEDLGALLPVLVVGPRVVVEFPEPRPGDCGRRQALRAVPEPLVEELLRLGQVLRAGRFLDAPALLEVRVSGGVADEKYSIPLPHSAAAVLASPASATVAAALGRCGAAVSLTVMVRCCVHGSVLLVERFREPSQKREPASRAVVPVRAVLHPPLDLTLAPPPFDPNTTALG
jgi:hypothetical protein